MIDTICLIIWGIVGTYCYSAPSDFTPPGTCIFGICFVQAAQLPVRASWYDPVLGGINCQEPCDLLGDGSPVDENYGQIIACPPGWYGRALYFDNIGERECRDSGGDIVPTCQEIFIPWKGHEYTCYITVDFLERQEPPWAYMLLAWENIK